MDFVVLGRVLSVVDSPLSLVLTFLAAMEADLLRKNPGYMCAFRGMLFEKWLDHHQISELALLPNSLGQVDECIYNNPCIHKRGHGWN